MLKQILAPIFIYIILSLIKDKKQTNSLTVIQQFYKNYSDLPRKHYPKEIKILDEFMKQHQNQKASADLIKKLTKIHWTVQITAHAKNQIMLFIQLQMYTIAQHIVTKNITFKIIERSKVPLQNVETMLSAEDSKQMEETNKQNLNISRLPNYDQLEISNRQGVFRGIDDKQVTIVPSIPMGKVISPEEIKRQAIMKKFSKFIENKEVIPSIGLFTLENSSGIVTCMDLNYSGTKCAAGFQDGTLKVFQIDSYAHLGAINTKKTPHHIFKDQLFPPSSSTTSPIFSISFSCDDTLILTGGYDGIIRLFSVHFKSKIASYNGHNLPIWDVKFAPTRGAYFASASSDRTARIWRTDQHHAVRILVGHIDEVECVEFSRNLQYVATSSSDRTLRLWEIKTGQCKRLILASEASIRCIHFPISDLKLIVCGTESGEVIVMNILSGKVINRVSRDSGKPIWSLCSDPNGKYVVSGCQDDSLEVYKLGELKRQELQVNLQGIKSLVVTLDNEKLQKNKHMQQEEENKDQSNDDDKPKKFYVSAMLKKFPTKNTPVLKVRFLERGTIVGAGYYKSV